jgi:hypothetical protein
MLSAPTRFAATICLMTFASSAMALEPIQYTGKLINYNQEYITFQTTTGLNIVASIAKRRVHDRVEYRGMDPPKVELVGTTTTKGLKPGQYVRFRATVIDQKRAVGEVTEITVISASADNVFGMLPDNLGGPAAGAPAAGDDPEEKKAPQGIPTMCIGQLVSVRGTNMTVAFPEGKTLKARFLKTAMVKLQTSDLSFAQPGDPVHVSGFALPNNQMFATIVKVTRPAEEPKKNGLAANNPAAPKPNEPRAPFNPGALKKPDEDPAVPAVKETRATGFLLKIK